MRRIIIIAVFICCWSTILAHPVGNIVEHQGAILWTYVNPVSSLGHYACIMFWDQKNEPAVLLTSEYSGSDYILYSSGEELYILERRFNHTKDRGEFRILKAKDNYEFVEIWPWQENQYRIGEAGFYMLTDTTIIYARYPGVYKLEKNKAPVQMFHDISVVKKIRKVREGGILLLTEEDCLLIDEESEAIIKRWDSFLVEVKDPPLNQNVIFDMDMSRKNLVMAYWGNRQFLLLQEGKRNIIDEVVKEYVPHWVLATSGHVYLFSSYLDFENPIKNNQSTISPLLVRFPLIKNGLGEKEVIWN